MTRGASMAQAAVLLVVPAFGIDTLVVAVGLGTGDHARRWRLALTLAAFEGGMPILGAFLGTELSHFVADVVYLAAALLIVLAVREVADGVRELRTNYRQDDGQPESEEEAEGKAVQALSQARSRGALLGAGLAVSLDELGAGLAAGAARLDLRILVPALVVQAILFTLLGLAAGQRLRRLAGRYGELAGGLALLLAAAVVIILGGVGI